MEGILNPFRFQMIQESTQIMTVGLDRILCKTLLYNEIMEKLIQHLIHRIPRDERLPSCQRI